MLVWETITDAKSGEVTRRQIELPGVVTAEAHAVVDAQTASVAALETRNELTLRQQADAALVDLRAYLDAATTTTAQDKAVLKLLVRVAICLIRLTLKKLDATG